MDFTQMPVSQGYKYLLVMIDTFTGWVEGFPTWTEKDKEVVKNFSVKSFQDLVCPGHYKVTMEHNLLLRSPKGSLKLWALLIMPIGPGVLSLQEKLKEQIQQFLNSAIKKITQETSLDGRRLYQYLSSAPILPLKPG